jgi:acyl-CoA reductase-like NAD-dependent aldehyde dehydrogenase
LDDDLQTILPLIGGIRLARTSGGVIENTNPATGETIGLVANCGAPEANAAVAAARDALPAWSALGSRQRAAVLERSAAILQDRTEEFALAETRDQGKPLTLSRTMDIPRAVENLRFFAAAVRSHGDESFLSEGPGSARFTSLVRREPVGVCALITPWNLPLYLLTWKLAPALAMGNTVVCKPSELTSTTASLLADVMHEAGAPAGVINMIFGTGPEAGEPLINHPGVDLISFTGGTQTGERIRRAAAAGNKKASLELGGKNASVVFESADLELAAKTCARAAFLNQGEICLAGSRVLVQSSIYDSFLPLFCKHINDLRVGDPEDSATTMGPVISSDHRNKIEAAVSAAINMGAKRADDCDFNSLRPHLSLKHSEGFFINPTVLVNSQPQWPINQDEIFGPVVSVLKFDNEAEAISIANGVAYGLSAAVFTQDTSQAFRMAEQLKVGTVWVNTWLARDLRVPFGGLKSSGSGREGGRWSLDFFSETKTIVMDHTQ